MGKESSFDSPPRRGRHSAVAASFDVLCYGTISLDNIVHVPAMPTPADAPSATADYYKPGGEALTVGVPLSTWGLDVAVAGNEVGEDSYADFIIGELARYPHVDGRWVARRARARTPFSRIFVTPAGECHTVRYWFDDAAYVKPTAAMVRQARLVTTTASGIDESVGAARLARKAGIPVISADAVAPDHPLVPLSDVLIFRAVALPGHFPETTPHEHARRLRAAGGGVVIVTAGDGPVGALDLEGQWIELALYRMQVIDPIGVESLFRAGILYGWLQRWPLPEIIRFANAAAAIWVDAPTAFKRPPTLAEIEALQVARSSATAPTGRPSANDRSVCPICQHPVDPGLFEKHWRLEAAVVQRLRDAYPAWRRVEGICPSCVRPFVGPRLPAAGPVLEEGHPIYGQAERWVWPTPARLYANPHYTGRGVVICFIDSGFYPHPDLTQPENRILACVDATRTPIIEPADFSVPHGTSWHGLMTSVVAAGNGRLSVGDRRDPSSLLRGLASDARLVLVKVSDPRGRINEVDILRGMLWVLGNHERYGINIINLSVGGDKPGRRRRSALNEAVDEAVRRGIVVVAAAGNTGVADLRPPASARGAITVGGLDDRNVLDRSMHRLYSSNWGLTAEGDGKPEVIAPSIWLAAPVLPGTRIAEQNLLLDRLWRAGDETLPLLLKTAAPVLDFDSALVQAPLEEQRYAVRRKLVENKVISPFYQHVDGTSFAAPIVSSVVAQMLEANPGLTPERVKSLLVQTAERLPNEPAERQGHGVVVPERAVAAALREIHGRLSDEPLSPYHLDGDIHFVYHDPRARSVAVIGDFNDWQPGALEMVECVSGVWRAILPEPTPGEYEYKFLVDRDRWLDDPENGLKRPDGYGGFNSVLLVC